MHPVDAQLIENHGNPSDDYETWVSSNGVDDYVKDEFTCGNCFLLALALHYKTKWPIKAKVIDSDVVHCYVVNPEGKAVDIYGVRPTDQAPTRYDASLTAGYTIIDVRPETPSPINGDYQWAEELVAKFPAHFGL